jgi:peptidoglycan hydrolase-like protein with peptidoglycan-binding domain
MGSSGRRRLRWLAAATLAIVVAAVLAVVLLSSGAGARHESPTGVPAGDITAAVTRRTLSESSTVNGTLGYGMALELYDRLGGTFTWLPSVGAVIGRGGTLWRIDDAPVVLMYGAVPAYRTLKQGVSDGADVTELNQNLIDLGFDPYGAIGDEESFTEATTAAVKRWQKAEALPETGEVELGRVVFAPSARRVTDVKVALGQDPPGAAPVKTGKNERPSRKGKKKKKRKKPAKHTPSKEKQPEEAAKEKPSKGEPSKGEPSKGEPSNDSPAKGSPGAETGAGAGEVVLTTTSTQQLVQLEVKPEQQQLARRGETVAVQLPGDGEARGRVTEVGTVASESSSAGDEPKGSPSDESSEPTIPVTIALDDRVRHLDEAPVSVELVKSIRRNVLTVPATALIAIAGDGYAVEALASSHDRRTTVPVTPGMFADGYVQVEGAGVREGMTVVESQ